MLCSGCQAINPANRRYCDACGKPLEAACPACRQANRPDARFCGKCGRALPGEEPSSSAPAGGDPALPTPLAALLGSRFAREGERKQVTVLFADIAGSTALIRDLDPEQALHRLEPGLEAMAAAVHLYGGTINRMQGDGIMASFGAPLAYEDHAVRACLAAKAMIEAIGRLSESQLGIRVGINSGEVVVRPLGHDLSMEYDATGPTTHLANRMEQLATPGTACIAPRTARLVRGLIELSSRGLVEIKGVPEPVELFQLIGPISQSRWQARSAAHRLTQFVGRETELRILSDALQRARTGRDQVVAIAGEAGMGKSRLVHEFMRDSALEGLTLLSGAATPHDLKTPYQLIGEMVRGWAGVESHDNRTIIDNKLEAALMALGRQPLADLSPLRSLLDLPILNPGWTKLDPTQRRQQTHDAVRSLIARIAGSAPCVILVEDVHWVDSESQSVLDCIIDGLGRTRVLIIVTYRPEYKNRWTHHSYSSLLQLQPLGADASDALLRNLLGDEGDLGALRDRLVEQTDGTPLFLEEMARSLVETGVLISEPTRFRLTQDVQDVQVPDSVQMVLASRIDRLPIDERTLLQIASVIGRIVPVALLQAVAAVPADQLARQLLELRAQEFVYEVTGSVGAEYSFKHALTHAVAYDSMLLRHRRALHGQVLAAVEQQFSGRIDEFTERLAEHALRGEVWEKAALYSLRAGQRANARSAHRLATMFFQHALDALAHLPLTRTQVQQAIDVRLGLRVALAATADLEQVRQYLEDAEALAYSIGDERRLMPVVISRATILTNLGALDAAVQAGLHGRNLAEHLNDETMSVSAGFALGQAFWNRGEFTNAENALSGAIATAMGDQPSWHSGTTGSASVLCLVSLSHTHCLTGRSRQAFERSRQALAAATETMRPYDLSYAHTGQGFAHLTIGELDDAIQHLEEAWRISQAHEIVLLEPHAARYLGRAYALAGRLDEANALLVKAIDQASSKSLVALRGWCVAALGLTRTLAGAHREAEALLQDALEFAHRQGYRPLAVHALRLLATNAARAGGADAAQRAEGWFRQATALAKELGMKPELAHCHRGFGDFLIGVGRMVSGREEVAAAAALYGDCGMASDAALADGSLATLAGCSEDQTQRSLVRPQVV